MNLLVNMKALLKAVSFMDKNKLRICIIGAGRVAQHYKQILASSAVTGFEVVGVCDVNTLAADSFASYWNCKSFRNLSDMLKETDAELVLVLTPSGMHFEHSKVALELKCMAINNFNGLGLPTIIKQLY